MDRCSLTAVRMLNPAFQESAVTALPLPPPSILATLSAGSSER